MTSYLIFLIVIAVSVLAMNLYDCYITQEEETDTSLVNEMSL